MIYEESFHGDESDVNERHQSKETQIEDQEITEASSRQSPYQGPLHGGAHRPPYNNHGGQHTSSSGNPRPPHHTGQTNAGQMPMTPPPPFVPEQPSNQHTKAVDSGAIRGCLYRHTFIWLGRHRSFWFYPVFIGRTSVAGYRWTRRRWVYTGIDLRQIRSFQCF